MEILYIYIHDYKKIQKQNINFGGKYRFHYDYESKELTVSENHQHIEGFYDKHSDKKDFARITNVTSIIGENGVGKTTILDFIYEDFKKQSTITSPFIFALKNGESIDIHYYDLEIVNKMNNMVRSLRVINLTKEKDEFVSAIKSIDLFKNTVDIELLNNSSFIRYSNVFDKTVPSLFMRDPYNLTTNYLIRNDFSKQYINNELPIVDVNEIDVYIYQEVFRQSQFLAYDSIKHKRTPFEVPRALEITLISPVIERDSIEVVFTNFQLGTTSFIKQLEKLFLFLYEISVQKKNYQLADLLVANAILNYFIREKRLGHALFSAFQKLPSKITLSKMLEDEFNLEEIVEFLELIFLELKKIDPIDLHSPIVNIREFYKYFKDIQSTTPTLLGSSGGYSINHFVITIDDDRINLNTFLNKYLKTFSSRQYLDFNWRNMSSGEEAFLTMFARLFSLSDVQNIEYSLKENIVLLMDEPDTNLHPQWQKTLLNSLLDFLPEIYGRKDTDGEKIKQRNIQIIFTTNNPISASDLLASNTIFMKLDNDKNVQIQDSLTDQRQTFGANIYSLYADSFFIQDGLMGKFASEKINKIIKNLNSLKPMNAKERETMRKTILQIGEPAIKNKLIQMYSDRYNLDIHERLDNLENKLNTDDQDTPE